MENLEELKKKYEEMTNKCEELGKEIERLEKEKKNKRWRAEIGEDYYFLTETLEVNRDDECNAEYDDNLYNLGNYFKTKEKAQKVANKIKTYIELKQLAEELNGDEEIDWTNGQQEKYLIRLDHNIGKVENEFHTCFQPLSIYCLDEEFADKALEQIGEERLIELFE